MFRRAEKKVETTEVTETETAPIEATEETPATVEEVKKNNRKSFSLFRKAEKVEKATADAAEPEAREAEVPEAPVDDVTVPAEKKSASLFFKIFKKKEVVAPVEVIDKDLPAIETTQGQSSLEEVLAAGDAAVAPAAEPVSEAAPQVEATA